MTPNPVLVRKDGPVTIISINRPHVRNAVDGPTARALAEAFRDFDRDPDAAVAILHGEGGTFCAGADLKAIGTDRGNRADTRYVGRHHRPDTDPVGRRRGWLSRRQGRPARSLHTITPLTHAAATRPRTDPARMAADPTRTIGYELPIILGPTGDNSPEQRRRAARTVAAATHDAADCALLLAMIGLTAADGLHVTEIPADTRPGDADSMGSRSADTKRRDR
ncbi:enoyl-CoA hydratase-related protein [Actinokineospora sp.]|uniref:enoyl-CoA hydratase-related protein n=1 Tax=Actinokineospora sp. TaxID=1872133 RepID=UPI003D6C2D91